MNTFQNLHRKRNVFYPILVLLVLLLGVFFLWKSIYDENIKELQNQTHIAAEQVAIRLEEGVTSHLAVIRHLRNEFVDGRINSPATFSHLVLSIQEQFKGFQAINFIDSKGFIRWVVPEAANIAAKDKDLHEHPTAAKTFNEAEETGNVFATPPVDLWQGGKGFATYFPIDKDGERIGYLNGVFRLDHFLDQALKRGIKDNFKFIISYGDEVIYSYPLEEELGHNPLYQSHEIAIVNRQWNITLATRSSLTDSILSVSNILLPLLGLLVSILISWFVRILLVRRTELQGNLILLEKSQGILKIRNKQQDRLLKTSRQLTGSLDINEVLQQIADEIRGLLGCYGVIIYMQEDEGKVLNPILSYIPRGGSAPRVNINDSLVGQSIIAKKGIIFNSSNQQHNAVQLPADHEGTIHLIVAPFIIDEEAVGAISIYRRDRIFTAEDLALVETFTLNASIAIHNAQVHHEIISQINERRQAQQQLATEKRRLADILEGTNVGTWEWNVQTGKTVFNERWAGIIGYTLEEISPTSIETWMKFAHPEDVKMSNELLEKHFIGELDYYECEVRMRHKNGNWVWVLDRGQIAERAKDGSPRFMSGTHQDITNRKHSEQQLEKALAEARNASKVKELFLANMSHEIRTPLNSIIGFSEIIRLNLKDMIGPEEEGYFEILNNSGQRLMNTVHGILDFSQIEAGTFEHNPKPVQIGKLVERIVSEYKLVAEKKNLRLTVKVAVENPIVDVDEGNLSRAISNLVDNALKYTDEGKVELILSEDNGVYILSISDTGIGISEEYLDTIYDAFSQESTGYTKKYQGLGMGLAIAKSCLEMDDVDIRIDSNKDVGTKFTLIFQPSQSASIHDGPEADITVNLDTGKANTNKRAMILVVEDESSSQQLMEIILKNSYDTCFAATVHEAHKLLNQRPIDLILLDLSLGGDENGLDLVSDLKKNDKFKQIPVIAVTAHAFVTDRENALEAGCNEYLSKPVKRLELMEKIKDHLVRE